ncbi:MAG: hypothetical protein H6702_23655, partial [Myxococcales bacterium]|nr:hypothetical protein [Myxococcales bacterium]
MIRAKAGASGLVLTLLWACGGADPEPVAPGVAEDFAVRLAACDAAGYWTVRYQASPPEQLGAHRYPDVLAVTPQGVIVDAIESLSCEAPVAARADWLDAGGCTLRVRAAFGCERRPGENLDLTLTLGSNAAGGSALVEPFDRDDGPWRFAAVAERSHLDTACVVPAPADLPATAYAEP